MGPSPSYIAIGRISGAHGIRGEVKVVVHTDDPERFQHLDCVYLGEGDSPRRVAVLGCRFHRKHVLLSLEGYQDRTSAETLRGEWVRIPLAEALPLGEDEVYEFQVLGSMVETVDGELLGRVTEVIFTGANEVFVVEGASGSLLVPVLKDVVLAVDSSAGTVLVSLPPGLRASQ